MKLGYVDLIVFITYITVVVLFGSWFARRSKTSDAFMKAGGALPGWAVGISLLGSYLSSNTFVGVVGKAFGSDWNFFVFSLALPIAGWIGMKYFVPFYRNSGEISAYHHMEKRFGKWARTYSVFCYLLIQLARIATITFGVSLDLEALTGWDISIIIIASGTLITFYTLLGGIEAVIWTDVVQSVVLLVGALFILGLIIYDMPGGLSNAMHVAQEHNKFSLGSFDLSIHESTFWVVILYSLFMNLKAFGFDQSNVQRYHTAKSDKEAKRAILLGSSLYLPISLIFFFIGAMLFSYYQLNPELLEALKYKVASNSFLVLPDPSVIEAKAASLTSAQIGDQAMPHYMSLHLPIGVAGLIIAAISAAAMSSIDTSLNSCATILLVDVFKRYRVKPVSDKTSINFLRGATLFMGVLGTGAALAMIGVESILAVWWKLTGILTGGMLGLFILGFVAKQIQKAEVLIALIFGILIIIWMTFSPMIETLPEWLKSPFHTNMIVIVSTLGMFLMGVLLARLKKIIGKR
ncbi:MAG: sodium:solute symporter [Cyclobacteriaceae bacterium]